MLYEQSTAEMYFSQRQRLNNSAKYKTSTVALQSSPSVLSGSLYDQVDQNYTFDLATAYALISRYYRI